MHLICWAFVVFKEPSCKSWRSRSCRLEFAVSLKPIEWRDLHSFSFWLGVPILSGIEFIDSTLGSHVLEPI